MIPRISFPASFADVIPWAAISFLGGVLLHAWSPFERFPSMALAGGAVMALGVVFSVPVRWRLGCVIVAIGVFGGLWRFDSTIPIVTPSASVQGVVVRVGTYDVRVRDDATGYSIKLSSTRYRVGERVRMTCKALIPLETDDEYATYEARKGTWFRCQGPTVARLGHSSGWNPRQALLTWRQQLTWRIQHILPGDSGALLSGILYGERNLSPDTSALFRLAGMTHLIAVSGSNIALVASLFVPLFLVLGYRRKAAIVLAGIAITSFVLFVGADASVVRAAIMGWLALLARVFGRKASASRLLVVAATVIVLFDPWALAFDAGFALSFLATWGLLVWARSFQERLTWIPTIAGLREAFATTLAATIVTTPYSLWAFGSVSLAGLLTNLLAIPLVGLAMLWGTVALVVGSWLPWFALPARGSLEAMLLISRLAGFAPWLQMSIVVPTWGLFLCYSVLWWRVTARRTGDVHYPQPALFEVNIGGLLTRSVGKS